MGDDFVKKNIFNILTLIIMLITAAISVGQTTQKVNAMQEEVAVIKKTVETIMVPRHEFEDLKEDVKWIRNNLLLKQ